MTPNEKEALRAHYRQRRAKRSPMMRLLRDAAVQKNIARGGPLAEADALLVYAPTRGEITLQLICSYARQRGIPVAYPRCEGDGVMQFYLVESETELVPGAYGIPAPGEECPLFTPTERTVMLVPALTYDREGYRLGQGGGYYDRYLATFRGVSLGVCYEEDVADALPREAHDLPVSFLVTDKTITRVRK